MTDPLDEWREGIQPVLARLEAFDAPRCRPLDFTEESLARLELLLRTEPPAPGLLESATAYAGEVLLRAGGGRWGWSGDQPVVRPDDALGRSPIAPRDLVARAELTTAYASLVRAVEAHRADHPGWAPVKEPTPGLDRVDAGVAPWLTDWLAEREKSFPGWAEDTGVGAATWDFTLGSVEDLELLVRRRVPTEESFADPDRQDFVQGAVWYLGEVARRTRPAARWQYHPAEPGSPDHFRNPDLNPWVGRPFIEQDLPDGNSTVPIFDLESAVIDGTPGYLRGRLATLD